MAGAWARNPQVVGDPALSVRAHSPTVTGAGLWRDCGGRSDEHPLCRGCAQHAGVDLAQSHALLFYPNRGAGHFIRLLRMRPPLEPSRLDHRSPSGQIVELYHCVATGGGNGRALGGGTGRPGRYNQNLVKAGMSFREITEKACSLPDDTETGVESLSTYPSVSIRN